MMVVSGVITQPRKVHKSKQMSPQILGNSHRNYRQKMHNSKTDVQEAYEENFTKIPQREIDTKTTFGNFHSKSSHNQPCHSICPPEEERDVLMKSCFVLSITKSGTQPSHSSLRVLRPPSPFHPPSNPSLPFTISSPS